MRALFGKWRCKQSGIGEFKHKNNILSQMLISGILDNYLAIEEIKNFVDLSVKLRVLPVLDTGVLIAKNI